MKRRVLGDVSTPAARFLGTAMPAAVVGLWLAAAPAWAFDQVDANQPLSCPPNKEVFFPRGDSWAFLKGNSCQGFDPGIITGADPKLDADAAAGTKPDTAGHCIWVSFGQEGPECKTTSCPADASELAKKQVFASMRKWAAHKAGNATFGSDTGWVCPSPGGNDTTQRKSVEDYTKAFVGGSAVSDARPSFEFFRGPDVTVTTTAPGGATVLNTGEVSDCYSTCLPGKTCVDPLAPQVSPPLFKCKDGDTKPEDNRFRFASARHHVLWVKGAGKWAGLGYTPTTLAVTETVFWPDNGVIITSDLLFNNENIDWRVDNVLPASPTIDYFGCSPSASCFHLETVATHESGHFLGFGHVQCTGAAMVPTALPDDTRFDLSVHEMAGICALYRPSPQGRHSDPSRENEGCLADSDCPATTHKCLFSGRSFYKTPGELATALDPSKLAHRGICVKAQACAGDQACETKLGRVCQPYNEAGTESYCLPGSTDRTVTGAALGGDICTACSRGSECGSACVDVAVMTANPPANAPKSICTVKCRPAAGCPNGFDCLETDVNIFVCVPQDLAACIDAAQDRSHDLFETCDETTPCAPGLTCYAFANGDAVCMEKCSRALGCRTPGFACVLPEATDAQGKPVVDPDAEGACFKKEMKEGDACVVPSSAVCGLADCKAEAGVEVCKRNPALGCFGTAEKELLDARCHAFCAQGKCSGTGQECLLINAQTQLGVCTPPVANRCLAKTGEQCSIASECDTGLCTDFGQGVMACSSFCDAANKSGCPASTECVCPAGKKCDAGSTVQGICRPKGQPLANSCPTASNRGCCSATEPRLETFAFALALLLLAVWRRRHAS